MNIVTTLHAALDHPESLWLAVTSFGRDEVFIVVLALYTWLVSPRGARALGVTFAASYLVNTLLKLGLNEPRPFFSDPTLASPAAQATAAGPGLPSGHTQLNATLWFGMALQQGRRWLWWVAAVLVALVGLSRVVLGVHFLSDVLIGLLLGAFFAWGVTRRVPRSLWAGAAALALALIPALNAYSGGLAILAAFLVSRLAYRAPANWGGRILVGLLGLLLTFAVYLGFRVLPAELRHSGAGNAIRLFLTSLVVTELVPLLFRRLMPRDETAPSGREAVREGAL